MNENLEYVFGQYNEGLITGGELTLHVSLHEESDFLYRIAKALLEAEDAALAARLAARRQG